MFSLMENSHRNAALLIAGDGVALRAAGTASAWPPSRRLSHHTANSWLSHRQRRLCLIVGGGVAMFAKSAPDFLSCDYWCMSSGSSTMLSMRPR